MKEARTSSQRKTRQRLNMGLGKTVQVWNRHDNKSGKSERVNWHRPRKAQKVCTIGWMKPLLKTSNSFCNAWWQRPDHVNAQRKTPQRLPSALRTQLHVALKTLRPLVPSGFCNTNPITFHKLTILCSERAVPHAVPSKALFLSTAGICTYPLKLRRTIWSLEITG